MGVYIKNIKKQDVKVFLDIRNVDDVSITLKIKLPFSLGLIGKSSDEILNEVCSEIDDEKIAKISNYK